MNTGIMEEITSTKELAKERAFALDICEEFIEFGGARAAKEYEKAKELILKAKSVFEIDRILREARHAY